MLFYPFFVTQSTFLSYVRWGGCQMLEGIALEKKSKYKKNQQTDTSFITKMKMTLVLLYLLIRL